jgi:hypothetical protein
LAVVGGGIDIGRDGRSEGENGADNRLHDS